MIDKILDGQQPRLSFPSTVTAILLPHHIKTMTARSLKAAFLVPLLRRTPAAETEAFSSDCPWAGSLQRVLIGQNVAELFHEHLSSRQGFPSRNFVLYPNLRPLATISVFRKSDTVFGRIPCPGFVLSW